MGTTRSMDVVHESRPKESGSSQVRGISDSNNSNNVEESFLDPNNTKFAR